MADWNLPALTSLYTAVLNLLMTRDVDAGTLCVSLPTNPPIGMFRYVRASDKLQEWDGTVWNDKVLSIAGGGTGGANAGAARTSLGLGDMATQNSTGVAITGGTLAGNGSGLTSLNAANLATGTAPTARLGSGAASATTYLRGDQTWAALVVDIPYGADQAVNFTPTVNTFYNVTGSHTASLPTVVGIGGKVIGLVMKGTGSWVIAPNGAETILGASTYTFDWNQYSCIVLKADANNSKWDII